MRTHDTHRILIVIEQERERAKENEWRMCSAEIERQRLLINGPNVNTSDQKEISFEFSASLFGFWDAKMCRLSNVRHVFAFVFGRVGLLMAKPDICRLWMCTTWLLNADPEMCVNSHAISSELYVYFTHYYEHFVWLAIITRTDTRSHLLLHFGNGKYFGNVNNN